MVASISGGRLNHSLGVAGGDKTTKASGQAGQRSGDVGAMSTAAKPSADSFKSLMPVEVMSSGVRTPAPTSQLRPANADTPLPTRSYSSLTREYTPAENQIRAVNRRADRLANEAAHQLAHDARVAAKKGPRVHS